MRESQAPVSAAFRAESIERVLGHAPQRIVIVGPSCDLLAQEWAARSAEVRCIARPADLEQSAGPCDAVLLDRALEMERWDRWLIQRVHRLLVPGGILVVSVPNLFDLWSAAGLRYVAGGAWKQVRRRFASKGAIPPADRSVFRGRRYALRVLRDIVTGVGFETVSVNEDGHGLGPLAKSLGRHGPRTARRLVLTARKLPSVWGDGRPFPACDVVMLSYRAHHAEALASRDGWRQRSGVSEAVSEAPIEEWARSGALVFAPHPDDEIIGCGGTLLDLVGLKGRVTIVQVSDGSDSAAFITESETERRRIRIDEARAVARRLGAAELACLEADNRNLRATPELRSRFLELLERARPGIAFVPSFTDIHPDHQVVLRLLAGALGEMSGPRPDVALYEVWSSVPPTHIRDVGGRIGEIEQLLLLYETALKIDDYVHLVAERLLFNSCEHRNRSGYLECFQVLSPDRFLALAAEHVSTAGVR